jgi:hypothetical protein
VLVAAVYLQWCEIADWIPMSRLEPAVDSGFLGFGWSYAPRKSFSFKKSLTMLSTREREETKKSAGENGSYGYNQADVSTRMMARTDRYMYIVTL